MILGKEYLIEAEQKGLISIPDHKEFSAFSLDIRVGKLFKRRDGNTDTINAVNTVSEQELSQESFIEQMLHEVPIPETGLEVTSNDFYLWQPSEEIYLSEGFTGEITTRSSWARLGISVRDQSDAYLREPFRNLKFRPLCILKTFGTNVLIKKYDPVAQLLIKYGEGYIPKGLEEELLNKEDFIIKLNDKVLKSDDVHRHGNIVLTMSPEILVYSGRILTPGKLCEDDFQKVTIKGPTFMPKGSFFLSSSEQYVEIPRGFVGYVTEAVTQGTLQMYMLNGSEEYAPMQFWSHPNAPYIGPKNVFKGKITFENQMKMDGYIFPGMKQSELLLKRLLTKTDSDMPSRYMYQTSATESKL